MLVQGGREYKMLVTTSLRYLDAITSVYMRTSLKVVVARMTSFSIPTVSKFLSLTNLMFTDS